MQNAYNENQIYLFELLSNLDFIWYNFLNIDYLSRVFLVDFFFLQIKFLPKKKLII